MLRNRNFAWVVAATISATLEVDSTALEAHGIFPLISFGSCEGDFASITVTGHGTVVKRAGGYVLDRSAGTMVIMR